MMDPGLGLRHGHAIVDREPDRVNFYWFLLIVVPLFLVSSCPTHLHLRGR